MIRNLNVTAISLAIELGSDFICYILCGRLFDVWLQGAPGEEVFRLGLVTIT